MGYTQRSTCKNKMKSWIAIAFLCLVGIAVAQPKVGVDHFVYDEANCEICLNMVKVIEDYVADGKTKEEAKKSAHGMCDSLPFLNAKCKAAADKIVDFLYNHGKPEDVCDGFCW